jgi:DNA-directed RNA polymerase subunit RPC12/RpoP
MDIIDNEFQNHSAESGGELVILKVFDNAIDLHILMARLESEGIECHVFDENIVSINPLYNITVGGIKLKVGAADLEKAKAVVAEIESTPYTDEAEKPILCPRCESGSLIAGYRSFKSVGGVLSAIASILFFIFPLYYRRVYRCKDCGYEFRAEKRS